MAISKNAGVETLKGSFKDIQPQVLENLERESIKKILFIGNNKIEKGSVQRHLVL